MRAREAVRWALVPVPRARTSVRVPNVLPPYLKGEAHLGPPTATRNGREHLRAKPRWPLRACACLCVVPAGMRRTRRPRARRAGGGVCKAGRPGCQAHGRGARYSVPPANCAEPPSDAHTGVARTHEARAMASVRGIDHYKISVP